MPVMETSELTPRQYWEQVKANPNRAKFGFGEKAAIINITSGMGSISEASSHGFYAYKCSKVTLTLR